MTIKFPASLFRLTSDSDGEAKITLVVPSESLSLILPLTGLTGKLLSVEIAADPSNG